MEIRGSRGRRGRGMGGHSRPVDGETVEWYTPPGVFSALGLDFALDPCAPVGGLPWIPAARFYSEHDDGLTAPWEGRVWMNPPYGPRTAEWMRRLASHGNGVALVFARTETVWWHETVPASRAVCFIRGRLTFVRGDGSDATSNSGAPSALIAFGRDCAEAVARSGLGMCFEVATEPLGGQARLWETL